MTGQSIDYARFAGTRGRGGGGRGGYAGNMGGVTPGREPQWQGGRTPVPMATGGRTPAWGAVGSSARMSQTPVIFPLTNDLQHQLGPLTHPRPGPPCGAKTP